jgi:antitoxin HicB
MITIPLVLEPQPEGGFTVTSPAVPGLVTEGETIAESLDHAWEALLALLEAYADVDRPLPMGLCENSSRDTVRFEHLIAA